MQGHLLEEWRIRDIEQKADQANRRLYELDTLRGNVDRLEYTNRELRSLIDGLCSTVETCLNEIRYLQQTVGDLQSKST